MGTSARDRPDDDPAKVNAAALDEAYHDRNLLACAFVVMRYGEGFDAGWWHDDPDDDEWAVIWTNLYNMDGEYQVGWHVPTEMVPKTNLPECDPEYDGYSTLEKRRRIKGFFDFSPRDR